MGRFSLIMLALSVYSLSNAAVYYVDCNAPNASDQNPGTAAEPYLTIQGAISKVVPGDSVYVKQGVYREEVAYPGEDWKDSERRITLSAFPGHRPVLKGSDILKANWERLPGDRAIYSCPREIYTQMLFMDEQPLSQIGLQGNPERAQYTGGFKWQRQWVGKGLEDMTPGSFFYDADAKRLYVWLQDNSDPTKHVMEVAVKDMGLHVQGTWTISGFDIRHYMDGRWPNEQAMAMGGNRCILENCRITHNEFLGLAFSGEECVIQGNEFAYNGLMGLTSNYGYRMLVENNEIHHNSWRGDVECLTAGNKFVMWRDSKFIRNRFHDEPGSALWLDISNGNILMAENRFDDCTVGIYFEISRWAIISNNILRNCGRGIWSYSSDVLIAHNVLDACGEGIVVSGYPRQATYTQAANEPVADCLMTVRNNLITNNLLIDCPGAFIGITEDDGFGAGNYSDYNAFAWTLPAISNTGSHLNFMSGWHSIYGRLPEWRLQRHYDTHSVIADPLLLKQYQIDNRWMALGANDLVANAGIMNRQSGDYRLLADSPLKDRGVTLPAILNSAYISGAGNQVVSRQFAKTFLTDAPAGLNPPSVYGGETGHYRLQPLPRFNSLVNLDACQSGTPGLNEHWLATGQYPTFDSTRLADVATDTEWMVYPENCLQDRSFDKPMSQAVDAVSGQWITQSIIYTASSMACANLLAQHQAPQVAYQKVGIITANNEYRLFGDLNIASINSQVGATIMLYLAAGDDLKPVGTMVTISVSANGESSWQTKEAVYNSGNADDVSIDQPLYIVLSAKVEGPVEIPGDTLVAFARWDMLTLLSSDKNLAGEK